MKLADDALIRIIEILRQGLMENKDISDLLRSLDLEQNTEGKLGVSPGDNADWTVAPETD
jgi:hypothetical protein